MWAKTYQYSGKFEWDTQTKSITKNGQPIAGRDSFTYPSFGWPISPNIGSKYLSLSKAEQVLRAEGMPHLTQSPNVASNFLNNWQLKKYLK